jgi:hypothetical protein
MWRGTRNEDPSNGGWTAGGRRRRVARATAVALVSAIAVFGSAGAPAAYAAAARGPALTIGVATLSPLVALIAGILILLMPRLLNYIVAIYLIAVGLIGLVGR